jgi:hypothetical protein
MTPCKGTEPCRSRHPSGRVSSLLHCCTAAQGSNTMGEKGHVMHPSVSAAAHDSGSDLL